jgi:cyclopropane-fatty-acyl-phospholipid synthase
MGVVESLVERGLVPDGLLRRGIRYRLAAALDELCAGGPEVQRERERALVARMRSSPITIHAEAANVQHYEVPAEFFHLVLGPRKKYSCCLWERGATTLAEAEEAMLTLTAERAGIRDGMKILDLGCGWGSFCLWAAERHPAAKIQAVSNSRLQKVYIEERAAERGLANLEVRTADVADFDPGASFDRIVSVEMFEHVRNVEALLRRIRSWLAPDGRLFIHVFSHRAWPYFFEAAPGAWLASEFFTGGMMPTDGLYLGFQNDLVVEDHWIVDGGHYARTLRAWLDLHDAQRDEIRRIFAGVYGADAARQHRKWRTFFIACEEAFAYAGGAEWRVSHFVWKRRE